MDDLRKLVVQYCSHKSLTSQEFALALIALIAAEAENEPKMIRIADALLSMAPVGGDGW